MVRALERILRRLVKKSVAIEIDTTQEACTINAVPVELDQSIMNLIVNSNDAMPDGGTLRLSPRRLVRAERQGRIAPCAICCPSPLLPMCSWRASRRDWRPLEHAPSRPTG